MYNAVSHQILQDYLTKGIVGFRRKKAGEMTLDSAAHDFVK
jgi:hypothetical protein